MALISSNAGVEPGRLRISSACLRKDARNSGSPNASSSDGIRALSLEGSFPFLFNGHRFAFGLHTPWPLIVVPSALYRFLPYYLIIVSGTDRASSWP